MNRRRRTAVAEHTLTDALQVVASFAYEAAQVLRSILTGVLSGLRSVFAEAIGVIGAILGGVETGFLREGRSVARVFTLAFAVFSTTLTEQQDAVRVAWSARGLASIATRLLSAADRTRYAEEFSGELWDLAEAKVGRWRQMVHAFRLLIRVVHLRQALKSPHRSKAES